MNRLTNFIANGPLPFVIAAALLASIITAKIVAEAVVWLSK